MERSRKKAKCCKKRLLRKKFKRHYLCSNQKLAFIQTIGSTFLERVRKVQNSKYEHDLLKIIDCFIDGYGFLNSDLVNFSIKNFFSIYFHSYVYKVTINYQKKNHRCQKHLQKNFQTFKKDVIFLLTFKKLQIILQFF